LFANLVAALEVCAAAVELLEVWKDKLKDDNSEQSPFNVNHSNPHQSV
jgi:hypothetical protein